MRNNMKIRNGFVSNSSSSSFVVLTTKENIKEALDKLPKKIKKFMKDTFICSPTHVEVDGKKYLLYSGTYYTDDWSSELNIEECTCGAEDYDNCTCMTEDYLWDHIKSFTKNVKPFALISEY